MSATRRVVVTGMGITSCLGNTLEEVNDSLFNAKSGIQFSEECCPPPPRIRRDTHS